MILDYNVGDQCMYLNYGTFVSWWHPARVTMVRHAADRGSDPYTTVEIITYRGQRLALTEASIKAQLRKRNDKERGAYPPVDMPVKVPVDAWEDIDEHTRRLKVRGGWLYKEGDAMCFVPGNVGRVR